MAKPLNPIKVCQTTEEFNDLLNPIMADGSFQGRKVVIEGKEYKISQVVDKYFELVKNRDIKDKKIVDHEMLYNMKLLVRSACASTSEDAKKAAELKFLKRVYKCFEKSIKNRKNEVLEEVKKKTKDNFKKLEFPVSIKALSQPLHKMAKMLIKGGLIEKKLDLLSDHLSVKEIKRLTKEKEEAKEKEGVIQEKMLLTLSKMKPLRNLAPIKDLHNLEQSLKKAKSKYFDKGRKILIEEMPFTLNQIERKFTHLIKNLDLDEDDNSPKDIVEQVSKISKRIGELEKDSSYKLGLTKEQLHVMKMKQTFGNLGRPKNYLDPENINRRMAELLKRGYLRETNFKQLIREELYVNETFKKLVQEDPVSANKLERKLTPWLILRQKANLNATVGELTPKMLPKYRKDVAELNKEIEKMGKPYGINLLEANV